MSSAKLICKHFISSGLEFCDRTVLECIHTMSTVRCFMSVNVYIFTVLIQILSHFIFKSFKSGFMYTCTADFCE